jgi:hypothetical protein
MVDDAGGGDVVLFNQLQDLDVNIIRETGYNG